MRAQPCTHTHTCVHTHTRSTDAGTMPPSPASLPVLVGDAVHPSTAQPPVPEDEAVHPSHVPLAYALIVTAPASLAAPALLPAPPATCSLPWPFAQILHSPFKTTTHTSMGTGPAKHLPVAGSDTTIQRPSVGTISLHPRGGHGRCERGCLAQVAGDWPDCAGWKCGGCTRLCCLGRQDPRTGRGTRSSPPAWLSSTSQPGAKHLLAKGGTGRGSAGCQARRALTPSPGKGVLSKAGSNSGGEQTGRVQLPGLNILPSQSR